MDNLASFLLGLFIGIILTVMLTTPQGLHNNEDLIKHNCAEYDSTTGKIKWKDK